MERSRFQFKSSYYREVVLLYFSNHCNFNAVFPGVRPDELVLPGYAWIMNHFWNGGFYPLGGPSEIAFQIIPIIERYGGRVLVDAPVTNILVDDTGRANGIVRFI